MKPRDLILIATGLAAVVAGVVGSATVSALLLSVGVVVVVSIILLDGSHD